MEGISNVRGSSPYNDPNRFGGIAEDVKADRPNHPLDGVAPRRRHAMLVGWFEMERQKQAYNRFQMAMDEDFYDNLQWTQEDAAEVMERGQAPLVYNRVAPSVDWITGMEKRMRVDFKVLPREKSDIKGAISKTKLLKYVGDVNRVPFLRSRAFEDTIKVGIGWVEDSAQTDPEKEPVYSDYVSWREIWWDSHARRRDLADARYLFRVKWVDLDVAISLFPDRAGVLKSAAIQASTVPQEDDDGYYLGQRLDETDFTMPSMSRRAFLSDSSMVENRRSRVKLIECWYRVPETVQVMVGGPFDRQTYDAKNAQHKATIDGGEAELFSNLRMAVHCVMMTETHLLSEMRSPYRHDRFPYTPFWCFQRGRDGLPYGYIRRVRDIQEDLNKRASKALFLLSTNQLVGDRDAFDDWDEAREEASRPDGVLAHKKGATIEIRRDADLAAAHLDLMNMDARMIQEIGGTTDDNLGRKSNAISGEAIRARQDQGMAVTASAFDNLRFGIQLQGETQLSLVEQFFSAPKVVRITEGKDGMEWLEINTPTLRPDGTVEFLNDITASKADFIVDQQDLTQTVRQGMFEYLMGVLAKLPPEISIQLLDLAVEFADLPGYEEFVDRIRKVNGHDKLGEDATPEQKAEVAARKQQQAEDAALQRRAALLELSEKEAKVNELNAKTDKTKADAAKMLQEMEEIRARIEAGGPTEAEQALLEQMQELAQKYEDQVQSLTEEINTMRNDLTLQREEIDAKYKGQVETARIKAQADENIARAETEATAAQSAAQESVDQIKDLIAELAESNKEQVDALRAEMKQELADAKRDADEREKLRNEREKGRNEGEREAGTGKDKAPAKGEDNAAMLARLMKELTASLTENNKQVSKQLADIATTVSGEKEVVITKAGGKVTATIKPKGRK